MFIFPIRILSAARRGLVERLAAGEKVVCAEGYLLELSRMGYIAHGVWVPEFILDNPEVLKTVHRMFIHAGSDVTEAYQVYRVHAFVSIPLPQLLGIVYTTKQYMAFCACRH